MQSFAEHNICIQRKLIALQFINYALLMSTRHKIYSELGFDGQAGTTMTLTHPKGKEWGICRVAPLPPNQNLKDADLVDTGPSRFYMISA